MLPKEETMLKIRNLQSGFTLVEIIVALSIFGILAGITIISYKEYQRRKNLDLAASEVKSALVESLTMSLAPKKAGVNGYGVYFEKGTTGNSYYIFEDKNVSNKYDAGEEIKTKNLPSNVEISSFTPAVGDNCSVVFTIPVDDPNYSYKKETYFGYPYKDGDGEEGKGDKNTGNGTLTFHLTSGGTKNITVNVYTNLISIH